MKKNLYLIVLFCFSTAVAFAMFTANVDSIPRVPKEKMTAADTLDRFASRLNTVVAGFDKNPPSAEERKKAIAGYKAIAAGYAANFHFKQGYIGYEKALSLKEKMLASEKAAAIGKENKEYEQRNSDDEQQVANLQSTQQQLSHDIDSLISKRKSFKSIFSIIIAVLSLLFAASLFKSGIKLKDLRNETTANRDKLMQNHRIALLGSLATGMKNTISSNNDKIKANASELLAKLPKDNKSKEIRAALERMTT